VSAGVSTWPTLAPDRVGLMQQADVAMYHAKRSSRNSVYAYGEFLKRE